ncbi:MAG: hypothetical protein J4F41_06890 [Alphaproteobacteria bacterium]|nr:hypothetical protein [Alphaproteobacteria bacterium]
MILFGGDMGEEDIRQIVPLKPGSTLTGDDIRNYCRAVMAKFMVLRVVTLMEKLPRTSTGKPEKGKRAALPLD